MSCCGFIKKIQRTFQDILCIPQWDAFGSLEHELVQIVQSIDLHLKWFKWSTRTRTKGYGSCQVSFLRFETFGAFLMTLSFTFFLCFGHVPPQLGPLSRNHMLLACFNLRPNAFLGFQCYFPTHNINCCAWITTTSQMDKIMHKSKRFSYEETNLQNVTAQHLHAQRVNCPQRGL